MKHVLMHCRRCKRPMSDDLKTCPYCGAGQSPEPCLDIPDSTYGAPTGELNSPDTTNHKNSSTMP
jgi:hypothetical protein